jgi:hypothetical protein
MLRIPHPYHECHPLASCPFPICRKETLMELIELTFAHCRSDGSILPKDQIAFVEQRCLVEFAHCFRGCQVHHLIGSYLTADNRILTEPCTVIRCYSQDVEPHLACLIALARQLAGALSQECVLLTITRLQGTMQWIMPEAPVPAGKQPALTSPLTVYAETL